MASGFYFKISQAIKKNQLSLPTLPDMAIHIRNAVADPQITLTDVSQLVSRDASLSHYLIQIANSPIYRGIAPIEDINLAIGRLGLNTTKNLVFSYSIRSLFQSKRSSAKKQLHWVWEHNQKLAALSATLAAHCKSLDSDVALLAGLFVNIGSLPIIQILEQRGELPQTEDALWKIMDSIADKIGTLILKHWGFDNNLVDVTRNRLHWDADHNPSISYVDVVLIAEALLQPPEYVSEKEQWFTQLPSRRKLALDGLSLTTLTLPENLQEAFEENLKTLSI